MTAAPTPYPEYRDSGVEWLGEIPAHWEVGRNKHLFQEIDDRSQTGRETLLSVSEYYGVKPRSDVVAEGEWITRAESLVGYKLCQPGDLAMNFMLAWKKGLGFSDYSGLVSPSYAVFRPVVNADYRYFHYLLRSMQAVREFRRYSYGIIDSRLRLYPDTFGSLRSPIPPLSEQCAIADFLDRGTARIDALVAKQQELIALLQEKRIALISHAVTNGLDPEVAMKDAGVEWLGEIPAHWEVRRLRHLGSKFGSGVTPRGGSAVYQPSGVPFLRSQNVHFDGIRMDEVARIPDDLHATLSGTHVHSGDVLLNITGASIGRVCAVPHGFGAANVNQHVCIIRPRQMRLHSVFLAACLGTPGMQAEIMLEQSGAAREGLTLASIQQFTMPLPPLSEQHAIVHHLEHETAKLDSLIAKAEDAIALLNEYRTALISAAVTGRIDVRQQVADLPEPIDYGPRNAKRTIQ